MESFLKQCLQSYEECVQECGGVVEYQRVATPFIEEDDMINLCSAPAPGDVGGRVPMVPRLLPWRQVHSLERSDGA